MGGEALQRNNFNSGKNKGSVIIAALSLLFSKISLLVRNSVIFSYFRNYNIYEAKYRQSRTANAFAKLSLLKHKMLKFKIKCAKFAEESILMHFFDNIANNFFTASLRSIGVFFLSFGGFILSANIATHLESFNSFNFSESFVFGAALLIISLFLLPSGKKSVACALKSSRIFSYFLTNVFSVKHINNETCANVLPTSGLSFFFGLVFGSVSHLTSPKLTLFLIAISAVIYLIMTHPENGILILCLALPFLNSKFLTFIIVLTVVSELLKIARGKRSAHFNLCSGALLLLGILLFSASVVSFDKSGAFESSKHIYLSMVLAIFVIMIVNSSSLAQKCFNMLGVSCIIASVYGIYYFILQYLNYNNLHDTFTVIYKSGINPLFTETKYFSAFLICAIPILLLRKEGSSKLLSAISLTIAVACLVLTSTYQATTALIISLVFSMIVFSKFGLWLVGIVILAFYIIKRIMPNFFTGSIEKYILTYSQESQAVVFGGSPALTEFFTKFWSYGVGQGDKAPVMASALTENTIAYYSGFGETYVNMAMHLGAPLSILAVLLVLVFVVRILSFSLSKNASNISKQLSSTVVASLVALFVYALNINIFKDFKTTILLFLLLSLGSSLADSSDNDYISSDVVRDNLYE